MLDGKGGGESGGRDEYEMAGGSSNARVGGGGSNAFSSGPDDDIPF
jgi:hypothetical protein